VDLEYVRANPHLLPTFLTHQRIRETPVGGGSICSARRLTFEDGTSLFVKSPVGSAGLDELLESEAAGLRWLRSAGSVPVPEVIAVQPDLLALEWIDNAAPSAAAAERFGRELAGLHRSGAPDWGAEWTGFIGSLPQDNRPGGGLDWPEWFARRRLEPYLRLAVDRGALIGADVTLIETVLSRIHRYGHPAEPPARLHGDLWPGNLVWTRDRVWLVDPAAHGGSRETDLAQLALFGGAPWLDRILAGYQEEWPLAAGWRERVPLHQLHLLLVHVALFGAAYREAAVAAAGAASRLG
jgi:fructosamine-3-kinase